jgi:DNA-binding GntR family transcriptional regulator
MAFEVMLDCKQKVDRLCLLSLEKSSEANSILKDHRDIAAGMSASSVEQAQASVRKHLSRLDQTIAFIHNKHPYYFE